LDYLHSYSLAHPNEIPVECYIEEALLEMSGVMLQQVSMMSGLFRLQIAGVLGERDDLPLVSGSDPSFHLLADALLKKHSWPTPPELSQNAFELLARLTFGVALSNKETLLMPDRETCRLAAGMLKSPKHFIFEAAKLMESLDEQPFDTSSQKKKRCMGTHHFISQRFSGYALAVE